MKIEEFFPGDAAAMTALGVQLASRLAPGDLITLSGPLGAGKTTLVQGLARGLGVVEHVSSPTYVLVNEYPGAVTLFHLDAYRLEDADEETLRDAGIDELLLRADAIKLVEWPEMIAAWLPAIQWRITIAHLPTGGRSVLVHQA